MKRRHPMPFGAEPTADGGARFRLWAPGAQRVDLLGGSGAGTRSEHPMDAAGDGWFDTTLPQAGPGFRYAYRIDGDLVVPIHSLLLPALAVSLQIYRKGELGAALRCGMQEQGEAGCPEAW